MAKTFVLVGYDHNNAFKKEIDNLNTKDDVVFIHAKPGVSIEKAIQSAGIGPGDSVMIEAHVLDGHDDKGVHDGKGVGQIEWNKNQAMHCGDIFRNLPEGVAFITVPGCFGESAQKYLADVKPGTILHASVSDESISMEWSGTQTAKELPKNFTPLDVVIQSLDNVDPNTIVAWDKRFKICEREGLPPMDPNKILPHTIGIGGHPPTTLNLDDQIKHLTENHASLNAEAMQVATKLVSDKFNTRMGDVATESAELPAVVADKEAKLHKKIALVSHKIQSGQPLQGLDETRIGYAITYAYLDKSGDLKHMIDEAKGIQAPAQAVAVQPPVAHEQAPAQAAPAQPDAIQHAPAQPTIVYPYADQHMHKHAPAQAPAPVAHEAPAQAAPAQPDAIQHVPAQPTIVYPYADQHMHKHAPAQAPAPVAQLAPAQEAARAPTVNEVQAFLNKVGVLGADGKPLVEDGKFGPNSICAYDRFCKDYGLDKAHAAGEFAEIMKSYKEGSLTRAELADIKADKIQVDRLSANLSTEQKLDIRKEFAGLRAAMMGSHNEHVVDAKMGELVATINHAVDATNKANNKGAGRYT